MTVAKRKDNCPIPRQWRGLMLQQHWWMMGALQTGAGHGNARRRAPETKDSSGMTIIIQRVVKATPEVHDLIGELNDVLGAVY